MFEHVNATICLIMLIVISLGIWYGKAFPIKNTHTLYEPSHKQLKLSWNVQPSRFSNRES